MVKNLAKLSLLVSVLLIAACSKSEPEAVSEQPTAEPPPTAEPSPETATEEGGSGDPTVLDPDHYMTEFENDAVRIVRIKYGAGEESVMHYHPDSVAVFLTDIQAQMTLPDGSTADIAASAGEAVFNSAGVGSGGGRTQATRLGRGGVGWSGRDCRGCRPLHDGI
jgi:hypothetical protein